jgi:hypothetical protein
MEGGKMGRGKRGRAEKIRRWEDEKMPECFGQGLTAHCRRLGRWDERKRGNGETGKRGRAEKIRS